MPKISALPVITSPDSADELPIVDTSTSSTKKMTLTKLKEWLQSLERVATATLTNKDLSSLTNTFQDKLLANVAPSSAFSTTSGSIIYVTSSNTAFTIPTGGATIRVSVDMNTQLTTSGASGQGVLELFNAANAGGSALQRRVPSVPTSERYEDASMSYVATLSAGSYTYSLGARTSTGLTNFAIDGSSTPSIIVVIL